MCAAKNITLHLYVFYLLNLCYQRQWVTRFPHLLSSQHAIFT